VGYLVSARSFTTIHVVQTGDVRDQAPLTEQNVNSRDAS